MLAASLHFRMVVRIKWIRCKSMCLSIDLYGMSYAMKLEVGHSGRERATVKREDGPLAEPPRALDL